MIHNGRSWQVVAQKEHQEDKWKHVCRRRREILEVHM